MTQDHWQLTEAEQREIQRLREELAGTKFCNRCDYCQPCTEEIPISTVLSSKDLPPEQLLSGIVTEAMEKAAGCSECGECETRCPFQLPIREMLAEHVHWYQVEKKKHQEQAPSR